MCGLDGAGKGGDCMECKLAGERFWQKISRWVRDGKKGGEEKDRRKKKKEDKNEKEWKKKKKKQAETDKICLWEIKHGIGKQKKKNRNS